MKKKNCQKPLRTIFKITLKLITRTPYYGTVPYCTVTNTTLLVNTKKQAPNKTPSSPPLQAHLQVPTLQDQSHGPNSQNTKMSIRPRPAVTNLTRLGGVGGWQGRGRGVVDTLANTPSWRAVGVGRRKRGHVRGLLEGTVLQ
jgi:hypothetical protein